MAVELSAMSTRRLLNSRFFKLFSFIVCLLLFYYFIRFFKYIELFGAEDSRIARFELGKVFSSAFEALFFEYLVGGSVWFLKFCFAFSLVFAGVSRTSLFLSFMACLLYLGFGGGRNILVEIGLMLFLFTQMQPRCHTGTKHIFRSAVVIFAIYLVSVITTSFRMGGGSKFDIGSLLDASDILFENFVIYFIGSFRALQYATENYQNIIGVNYGLLTLSGLDDIFSLALRLFGFNVMPFSNFWGTLLAEPIFIGRDIAFNALYTAAFNFYFDLYGLGVAIGGLAFGLSCSFMLRRFSRKAGIAELFTLSAFFVTSMLTPLTWKLASGPLVLLIGLLFLLQWLFRSGLRARGS